MSELIEVRDLKKYFPIRGGLIQRTLDHVRAVDGISFAIREGTTLGLVGESGCGKTTVGRTILRLTDPTEGSIKFRGREIANASRREMRALRPKMQIVFQDPMSSLNPRMTVRQTLMEPLLINGWSREKADDHVAGLLQKVGLNADHQHRFPHEFSGGQRQRIGVARALALNPDFVVLDEPTSALDVSVQAQVLNLLRKLQRDMRLTYLFISHDLSVVRHLCDEVAVMYLGRIVEQGPVDKVFGDPQHPYTQALLSAVPIPDPELRAKRIILTGDVPSPINPPPACRFHPRCPRAQLEVCAVVDPPLEEKQPRQLAACHFPGPQERWPVTQTRAVKVEEA
ncbi:MAG TPA: dipeptide ABC transporter ATP-binding protein [Candidatus Thermoplasmatota archaeon]|nr:dipeptide ABC transporter ATP-binding protein [Candidatus Thermoplasmatota archaeon]